MITVLEQHSHCGEGILSLDHDMYVYFAPAFYTAEQAGTHLVAFRVPAGVMLTIRPGVWHCMAFSGGFGSDPCAERPTGTDPTPMT